MAESFVQVAPDSTGKMLRTQTSTQAGNTVHEEVMVLADAAGNMVGTSSSAGVAMQVALQDSSATAFLRNSAANLGTATQTGAQMVAGPANWTQVSQPAVGTLASAVRASGGAGVRHVCNAISFSWSTDGTANGAAQQITVNLRDGGSGAGTVLMTWSPARTTTTATDAGNSGHVELTGLNIIGSAATAMTLEFAGTASSHEQYSANVVGYDVS